MGEIIEIAVIMIIIAGLAFLPLGYFINNYTTKNGEPFGDIEPHGDKESPVLVYAAKLIALVKGFISKK